VQDLASPEELLGALMASASVPPFMPVGRIGGMAALDGGLVDNVPTEPLLPVEERGGKTLVILSRLYRAFPQVNGRTYVQPSEPVPVGQFDITNPRGIRKAYEMGLRDGEAFSKRVNAHSV
jgi:predicted acylesterase/phospholipase RssA